MSSHRLRFLLLAAGCLLMTAGSVFLLTVEGKLGGKVAGVVGILFFGTGLVLSVRAAASGQAWPGKRKSEVRGTQFIVPLILLFTLPWALKLWFCVPLLLAWGVLAPRYRDRRVARAACIVAIAIAFAQAVLFAVATLANLGASTGTAAMSLQLVFLALLLWLDFGVLWKARQRLRAPVAAAVS